MAKTNKGFTLIELLAVITILAIILLIAIPKVLEVVNNSKISSFNNNEGILSKAAQTYLANNNTLLPVNIGDVKKVNYTDIKSSNLISSINDFNDKTECTNSRVIVEKITAVTYKYTPVIFCNNHSTTIGGVKIVDDFSGTILINHDSFASINPGEIWITAGTLTLYNKANVNTLDRMAVSHLEGTSIAENNTYLMYIGSDESRFVTTYTHDYYLITKYENNTWYYNDNSSWLTFTTNDNDYLLGQITKDMTDGGLTYFYYLYEK